MGHDGAKMGHDSAKMGHDSAKMGHDSAKMGILGSTWELLEAFWKHFLTISAAGLESEKPSKTICFYVLFLLWGARKGCLRHLRGCLRHYWLEDGVFRDIFRHVGAKLANKRSKMATCWRQDGAQERQDGDQERQDEPR